MTAADCIAALLADRITGGVEDALVLYEEETGDTSLRGLNADELQVLFCSGVARAWAGAGARAGARGSG